MFETEPPLRKVKDMKSEKIYTLTHNQYPFGGEKITVSRREDKATRVTLVDKNITIKLLNEDSVYEESK